MHTPTDSRFPFLSPAIAAGFASQVWSSFDELRAVNTAGQTTFAPELDAAASRKLFRRWERAVAMCKGWLADEEAEEGKAEEAGEVKASAAKDEEASRL